jgi:phosphoglycolate phosphatase
MIGDREHDMLGANGHGLLALGVTWGYGSRAELLAAGADTLLDTIADLPEIIRRLDETPRPLKCQGAVSPPLAARR